MRWAGIDYGRKRIGLALSDYGGRIASPAATLSGTGNGARDAAAIARWMAENEAVAAVVGLPLNMDGSDSDQTRLTRKFADELRKHPQPERPFRVELWDERLSSFQADQYLAAAELPPQKRKALRDALAAQVILQAFLDAAGSDKATT